MGKTPVHHDRYGMLWGHGPMFLLWQLWYADTRRFRGLLKFDVLTCKAPRTVGTQVHPPTRVCGSGCRKWRGTPSDRTSGAPGGDPTGTQGHFSLRPRRMDTHPGRALPGCPSRWFCGPGTRGSQWNTSSTRGPLLTPPTSTHAMYPLDVLPSANGGPYPHSPSLRRRPPQDTSSLKGTGNVHPGTRQRHDHGPPYTHNWGEVKKNQLHPLM